jgi:hypothetical protein
MLNDTQRKKQCGFTFVEMLIAFSLLLFLITSLYYLFTQIAHQDQKNGVQQRLQHEGIRLLFRLKEDIKVGENGKVSEGLFQILIRKMSDDGLVVRVPVNYFFTENKVIRSENNQNFSEYSLRPEELRIKEKSAMHCIIEILHQKDTTQEKIVLQETLLRVSKVKEPKK